ncbi:MAG: glycosyltransferase family 4 protein [Magnetospirillum sp.]|nr:glycosyltransferase family 4 protein [Magnetospirillum sp.]
MIAAGAAAIAFLGTAIGMRPLLAWLNRHDILDHPNERSSHQRPTPRGGGLALTPALLLAWAFLATMPGPLAGWIWVMVAGGLVLLTASWADDRHTLPPAPRLLAHAAMAGGALVMLPEGVTVFQGALPLWADRLLAGLGWVWFINLFNFMDGIDGISGVETASIGAGAAAVVLVGGAAVATLPLALACTAAALGFLVWNWHPARIFLGDSGSVPLGFLLGGLLIQLAAAGELAAALILPAYYLADATITIVWRLKDGETVWQAHRRHFYQRAVQGGRRHDQVALAVLVANLLLIGAAMLSVTQATAGLAAAALIVAGLLTLLQRWSRGDKA